MTSSNDPKTTSLNDTDAITPSITIPLMLLGRPHGTFVAKCPQDFKDFLHGHPQGGFFNYKIEVVWKLFKDAGFDLKYENKYDFNGWINSDYKLPLGATFEPYDSDDEAAMDAKYERYSG
jgi:hypothetical protein